jgi:peptidyl-prolyl cis-trans isomerase C
MRVNDKQHSYWKALSLILASLVLLTMAGCFDSSPSLSDDDLLGIDKEFADYLVARRITPRNDAHREQLLQEYRERAAIAAQIETLDAANTALINAELNDIRRELMIRRYMEKYLQQALSDSKLKEYYQNNAELYEERRVRVSHILFRTHEAMTESEKAEKLKLAQQVRAKIASSEDFASLARETSEDTASAQKGGEMGWLNTKTIDSRFAEAIAALSVGEISNPVATNFGYQIIMLLEEPSVVTKPIDLVQQNVKNDLREQLRQAELSRLLKESGLE